MNTTQAARVLRCDHKTLTAYAKQGKLKKVKLISGRLDWDDHMVYALAGIDAGTQINVIYARTEPYTNNNGTQPGADERLENQKQRLLKYCQDYGVRIDLVIGEVRRVNRIRDVVGGPAAGFSALLGLVADGKVNKLIIESRDRLSVGGSWEMIEWVFRVACGVEIVVVNKLLVTTESREESKYWIADMLQIYKAMTGEIKDKRVLEQFWGGPDAMLTKKAVRRIDEQLRQKKKLARATGQETKKKKQYVDLDDIFS